jgi:hypothetical protein
LAATRASFSSIRYWTSSSTQHPQEFFCREYRSLGKEHILGILPVSIYNSPLNFIRGGRRYGYTHQDAMPLISTDPNGTSTTWRQTVNMAS